MKFSADKIKRTKINKAKNRNSSNQTDSNRKVAYMYSSSKKRNKDIKVDTTAGLPKIPKKKQDSGAGPSKISKTKRKPDQNSDSKIPSKKRKKN